jgi:radical SAM-linked protein
MIRLRITFSKSGALRYTGHLDLHSLWERTARRARLPLAYTQGFHPGPRLQLASALPLGFIGRAEILDMWINAPPSPLDPPIKELLQKAAPPGLVIASVEVVDDHGPALQTRVVSAEYEVTLLEPCDAPALAKSISTLLAAPSLSRERRGKSYDLRPLIESLELLPLDHTSESGSQLHRLHMRLAARQGATGRPEEVLDALAIPFETTRIERTALILS